MTFDRRKNGPSGVPLDLACIVKRFDAPEEALELDNGRLEVIAIGGGLIGKGSYGPGWRWSEAARTASPGDQSFDYVGVVLSGRAKIAIGEGEVDLTPGDFFHVAGELDLRVIGARPCEVLFISGVEALMNQFRRGSDG